MNSVQQAPNTRLWTYTVLTVPSECGPITVTIGDPVLDVPSPSVIFTYNDIGISSYSDCFGSLLNLISKENSMSTFRFVHIDIPGHGINSIDYPTDIFPLSIQSFAQHVELVRAFLDIDTFIGLGVGLGSVVFSHYAVSYPTRISSLVLIGPQQISGSSLFERLSDRIMSFFSIIRTLESETTYLLSRYFSSSSISCSDSSDLIFHFSQAMANVNWNNYFILKSALNTRLDISERFRMLKCPVLVITGENSIFFEDSINARALLTGNSFTDWVSIPNSGLLVTESTPRELLVPLHLFLHGLGFFPADI